MESKYYTPESELLKYYRPLEEQDLVEYKYFYDLFIHIPPVEPGKEPVFSDIIFDREKKVLNPWLSRFMSSLDIERFKNNIPTKEDLVYVKR